MDTRRILALLAVIVAFTLVASPVTMADWSEQASISAEQVDESQVRERTPIIQYDNLSGDAQDAVRNAIESSDGYHTVYGREDWPDRFFYSDYTEPGQGMYAIVYEDQYYRVTTYAAGGFPFVYWLLELPFIAYGFALAYLANKTYRGDQTIRTTVLATLVGISFHLLGPEFDFPLLATYQFTAVGAIMTGALVVGLGWQAFRAKHGKDAD